MAPSQKDREVGKTKSLQCTSYIITHIIVRGALQNPILWYPTGVPHKSLKVLRDPYPRVASYVKYVHPRQRSAQIPQARDRIT